MADGDNNGNDKRVNNTPVDADRGRDYEEAILTIGPGIATLERHFI